MPTPENVDQGELKENASNKLKALWDILDKDEAAKWTTDDLLQKLELSETDYQQCHCDLANRKSIVYKREPKDIWINPYIKTLLLAWNANMDIQPVIDAYSCIMYIVSYISKSEREMGDLLRTVQSEAQKGHTEPAKQLQQLGNVFLQNRDLGVMEAVFRVTGMKLKYNTRQVVFLPSDPQSAR